MTGPSAKFFRESLHLSRAQFAVLTGMSVSTIRRVEASAELDRMTAWAYLYLITAHPRELAAIKGMKQ